MKKAASELILHPDGSIYHHVKPGDIGPLIFTVGDPARVPMVSHYFDEIYLKKSKREFLTHTGRLGNHTVSVISSGIGTDNIDILINEIDALFNIDLASGMEKESKTELTFIRLGTSGSIRKDIPVDTIVVSDYAIGMDSLAAFYIGDQVASDLGSSFARHLQDHTINIPIYAAQGSRSLASKLLPEATHGITISCPGFYGPQARSLRLRTAYPELVDVIQKFSWRGMNCTNLEMESSGIYFLSSHLGHRALSINAILGNRLSGQFTNNPKQLVDKMIRQVLEAAKSI